MISLSFFNKYALNISFDSKETEKSKNPIIRKVQKLIQYGFLMDAQKHMGFFLIKGKKNMFAIILVTFAKRQVVLKLLQ